MLRRKQDDVHTLKNSSVFTVSKTGYVEIVTIGVRDSVKRPAIRTLILVAGCKEEAESLKDLAFIWPAFHAEEIILSARFKTS